MKNINNDNVNSLPSNTQPISDIPQPSPIPVDFHSVIFETMKRLEQSMIDTRLDVAKVNSSVDKVNSDIEIHTRKVNSKIADIQYTMDIDVEQRKSQMSSVHEEVRRLRSEIRSRPSSKSSLPGRVVSLVPGSSIVDDAMQFASPRKASPPPVREHAFVGSDGNRSLV